MKKHSAIPLDTPILFIGGYGEQNTGDDVFCAVSCACRDCFQENRYVGQCRNGADKKVSDVIREVVQEDHCSSYLVFRQRQGNFKSD